MAPTSELILASYRRTHPDRELIKERSSKTFWALEQQNLLWQPHSGSKIIQLQSWVIHAMILLTESA